MNIPPSSLPLHVDEIVKTYHQGTTSIGALNRVSMSVEPGEFVAIMGASGSGKSTLLHAIAGLIDVDSGRVVIAGHDLSQFSDAALTKFRRNRLGMVFQAYNLIACLSAEDNIRLPAVAAEGLEREVDALLDRLGLIKRRHHMPAALSGGEQQRVAIARALIGNPAVLLADEPTGSLDSISGTHLCHLLRSLVDDQGRCIVMVTHEPHVAMWADRVLVLQDGESLAEFATDGQRDPQSLAHQYHETLGVETVH